MKRQLINYFGIFVLVTVSAFYITTRENIFQKAAQINLTGNAVLRLSKSSYQLNFQKLSKLDESKIDAELKKIHQITEKITTTSISTQTSNKDEIMLVLAKTIDQNIVLVLFKNQQIQMIQKVLSFTKSHVEFQYGQLDFSTEENPTEQLAYSQNIELDF